MPCLSVAAACLVALANACCSACGHVHTPEDAAEQSPCAGAGASPEGNKPFLDVLDLETKQTQRLWQSRPPFLEDTGSLLTDQHDQPITYALPPA